LLKCRKKRKEVGQGTWWKLNVVSKTGCLERVHNMIERKKANDDEKQSRQLRERASRPLVLDSNTNYHSSLASLPNLQIMWMLKPFRVEIIEINGHGDPLRWSRDTLHQQNLAVTSPTSSGRLRTKDTEFSFLVKTINKCRTRAFSNVLQFCKQCQTSSFMKEITEDARSKASTTLGSCIRILLEAWISVCVYSVRVFLCEGSQRPCDRLIHRPRSPTDSVKDEDTENAAEAQQEAVEP
jgi:hypothetical protein